MDQRKRLMVNPVYRITLRVLIFLFVILVTGFIMLSLSPKTGAYGADFLRKVIGNRPVAWMEMTLFQFEDGFKKAEYNLGLLKPEDPFSASNQANSVNLPPTNTPIGNSASKNKNSNGSSTIEELPSKNPPVLATGTPSADTQTNPKGTRGNDFTGWSLTPAAPLGGQLNEGIWQPYLKDTSGRIVAYRTLVYPDPNRPYAFVAVVAFNLQAARLHYVIGFNDPYAPGVKKLSKGDISPTDTQSNLLIATFNGGFKYEHGNFGSMADGLISAPAQNGMGTLAIYRDGKLKIGEWGKDILSTDNLAAFRQNGPLVIKDGAVNPRVDDSLIWGLTISGGTVTMRSGIAISPDQQTLYYFAGPSLSVRTLAKAMETVHPQAGIQLDINNFWVHFTAEYFQNGKYRSDPLFVKGMSQDLDRYLKPYPRDFFYISLVP